MREEDILKQKQRANEQKKAIKKEEPVDTVEVKLEKSDLMDSDEEMYLSAPPVAAVPYEVDVRVEEKPKVPVLASVEERASQALKMQPYELAKQTELSDAQKKELLKMSIQRIFHAERVFQSYAIQSDNSARKEITDGSATATAASSAVVSTNPTKNIWLLLVAKLITRGTNMKYKPTNTTSSLSAADNTEEDVNMEENRVALVDTESSANELKELLLDFIVENLLSR
jgi:hypothetical protein